MDIDFYNANFLSFKQNAEINELQLNLVKTSLELWNNS